MTGKLKLPRFQSQLPILVGIIVLMMICSDNNFSQFSEGAKLQ